MPLVNLVVTQLHNFVALINTKITIRLTARKDELFLNLKLYRYETIQ